MKKRVLSLLFSSLSGLTYNTQAHNYPYGRSHSISVAEAKKLPDNAYVVLEGEIVSRANDDKYWFKDNTGRIQVEVDEDEMVFKRRVQLIGEVERNDGQLEINVERVHFIQ
jgi:uncharacterized protein (TIGR00156 family)